MSNIQQESSLQPRFSFFLFKTNIKNEHNAQRQMESANSGISFQSTLFFICQINIALQVEFIYIFVFYVYI